MTAIHLGTFKPDSPEWHAARAEGIGASEIAAAVGLSPYQSPFHLWHVKKGNIPGPQMNDAMDWGHRLEPLVIQWWNERHDNAAEGNPGTFAHKDRPWQRCNPDALIYYREPDPGSLLQVKTSRYGDGFGPSGSDQIPLHYRCQVMQEMDVLGFDHCWLAVLIGGNDPREYRIDYDPADAATLREAGAAFWASLQTDDEPPIDASDSTYQAVRELHPDIDRDSDVEIDPDLWAAYHLSKAAAETSAAEHQQIKSTILAAMGQSRLALVNGTARLRRQPTRNGVALYTVKESA